MARILYFSRDYTTHDHRFLSALAQTEHTVYFLRLENRGNIQDERSLPPEIELIPWIGGTSPARLQDCAKLLIGLKKVIRKLKPDIVQAGPIQRSAFLVALSGFHPLISMSWGYDLLMDAHRNQLWNWVTRFTLKRSAAMIGDSKIIQEKAGVYGMPPEKIVTFPWGADIHKYSPGDDGGLRARKGWDEDTFLLLSTRGWAPIYGVEVLAKAFVQAARKRPELRLFMLSGGSQAILIKRILIQGDVLDKVEFPGQVNQHTLPNYFRAADLYISTSHSDGTSISMLEALASGCPVVLSDIPGNKEWINPGQEGWLFKVGNVNSLANAILYAVDNRDHLPQMGRIARKLAEKRGDWEMNFPQLMNAYKIAMSGTYY